MIIWLMPMKCFGVGWGYWINIIPHLKDAFAVTRGKSPSLGAIVDGPYNSASSPWQVGHLVRAEAPSRNAIWTRPEHNTRVLGQECRYIRCCVTERGNQNTCVGIPYTGKTR